MHSMAPWLRLYKGYLVHFTEALGAIQIKNKLLQSIIEAGISHPLNVRNIHLQAMLIEPVQRLPRYPLLIKALLKHTPPEHPDFKDLEKADKELSDIASIMDAGIETAKKAEKLAEIQSLFSDLSIVEPHRFFVHEGDVTITHKDASSTKKSCKLFIFNDKVLYATKSDINKYTEPKFISFPAEVQFSDVNENDENNSFLMSIKEPKSHLDLLVETKSEEEKTKWLQFVETTLKEQSQSQHQKIKSL